MRFVDPETSSFEKEPGAVRHSVDIINPFNGKSFHMVAFTSEFETHDDIIFEVEALGLLWSGIFQLDSTPRSAGD